MANLYTAGALAKEGETFSVEFLDEALERLAQSADLPKMNRQIVEGGILYCFAGDRLLLAAPVEDLLRAARVTPLTADQRARIDGLFAADFYGNR